MNSKAIQLISTRMLNPFTKSFLFDNGIFISDFDFLKIDVKYSNENVKILKTNNCPLVILSINAALALKDILNSENIKLKDFFCFAIDGITSNYLQENGAKILGKAKNSSEISKLIIKSNIPSVLIITSNFRLETLKEELDKNKISNTYLELYSKEFNPKEVILQDGIVFFSPSQINSFFTKNTLNTTLPAFCIGATTAHHLKICGHENIIISESATEKDLANTILNYFN